MRNHSLKVNAQSQGDAFREYFFRLSLFPDPSSKFVLEPLVKVGLASLDADALIVTGRQRAIAEIQSDVLTSGDRSFTEFGAITAELSVALGTSVDYVAVVSGVGGAIALVARIKQVRAVASAVKNPRVQAELMKMLAGTEELGFVIAGEGQLAIRLRSLPQIEHVMPAATRRPIPELVLD